MKKAKGRNEYPQIAKKKLLWNGAEGGMEPKRWTTGKEKQMKTG